MWALLKYLVTSVLQHGKRYHKGRQNRLGGRQIKTMANKLKQKTNIEHLTLHWKLKLEYYELYKDQSQFRYSGRVSNSCSTDWVFGVICRKIWWIVKIDVSNNRYRKRCVFTTVWRYPLSFVVCCAQLLTLNIHWI